VLLVAIGAILLVTMVAVAILSVIYWSRNRHPVDYSDTLARATATYLVTYDGGSGMSDNIVLTRKVIQTGVKEDSQLCLHEVTVYDANPKRKVSVVIFGSIEVTLESEELWLNQTDLRMVKKTAMQKVPYFVNTVSTDITYSQYDNYPGWPYHAGDNWTYQAHYAPDISLQSPWTYTFRAEVASDNAVVQIDGVAHQCFKVVHTLVESTNKVATGGGVGATIIEYWYKDGMSIGPIRVEDYLNFAGTETMTMAGTVPLPQF